MSVNCTATLRGLDALAGTPKEPMLWRRLVVLQRQNVRERTERREGEDGEAYSASKRSEQDGGFTLLDKGHMLNAMTVKGATPFGSRLGFISVTESKKAFWAHFGTRPHDIFGKGGRPLAWKSRHAFSSIKTQKSVMRSESHFADHVHHPGTKPRPFWGFAPSDLVALERYKDEFIAEAIKKSGLGK